MAIGKQIKSRTQSSVVIELRKATIYAPSEARVMETKTPDGGSGSESLAVT